MYYFWMISVILVTGQAIILSNLPTAISRGTLSSDLQLLFFLFMSNSLKLKIYNFLRRKKFDFLQSFFTFFHRYYLISLSISLFINYSQLEWRLRLGFMWKVPWALYLRDKRFVDILSRDRGFEVKVTSDTG